MLTARIHVDTLQAAKESALTAIKSLETQLERGFIPGQHEINKAKAAIEKAIECAKEFEVEKRTSVRTGLKKVRVYEQERRIPNPDWCDDYESGRRQPQYITTGGWKDDYETIYETVPSREALKEVEICQNLNKKISVIKSLIAILKKDATLIVKGTTTESVWALWEKTPFQLNLDIFEFMQVNAPRMLEKHATSLIKSADETVLNAFWLEIKKGSALGNELIAESSDYLIKILNLVEPDELFDFAVKYHLPDSTSKCLPLWTAVQNYAPARMATLEASDLQRFISVGWVDLAVKINHELASTIASDAIGRAFAEKNISLLSELYKHFASMFDVSSDVKEQESQFAWLNSREESREIANALLKKLPYEQKKALIHQAFISKNGSVIDLSFYTCESLISLPETPKERAETISWLIQFPYLHRVLRHVLVNSPEQLKELSNEQIFACLSVGLIDVAVIIKPELAEELVSGVIKQALETRNHYLLLTLYSHFSEKFDFSSDLNALENKLLWLLDVVAGSPMLESILAKLSDEQRTDLICAVSRKLNYLDVGDFLKKIKGFLNENTLTLILAKAIKARNVPVFTFFKDYVRLIEKYTDLGTLYRWLFEKNKHGYADLNLCNIGQELLKTISQEHFTLLVIQLIEANQFSLFCYVLDSRKDIELDYTSIDPLHLTNLVLSDIPQALKASIIRKVSLEIHQIILAGAVDNIKANKAVVLSWTAVKLILAQSGLIAVESNRDKLLILEKALSERENLVAANYMSSLSHAQVNGFFALAMHEKNHLSVAFLYLHYRDNLASIVPGYIKNFVLADDMMLGLSLVIIANLELASTVSQEVWKELLAFIASCPAATEKAVVKLDALWTTHQAIIRTDSRLGKVFSALLFYINGGKSSSFNLTSDLKQMMQDCNKRFHPQPSQSWFAGLFGSAARVETPAKSRGSSLKTPSAPLSELPSKQASVAAPGSEGKSAVAPSIKSPSAPQAETPNKVDESNAPASSVAHAGAGQPVESERSLPFATASMTTENDIAFEVQADDDPRPVNYIARLGLPDVPTGSIQILDVQDPVPSNHRVLEEPMP